MHLAEVVHCGLPLRLLYQRICVVKIPLFLLLNKPSGAVRQCSQRKLEDAQILVLYNYPQIWISGILLSLGNRAFGFFLPNIPAQPSQLLSEACIHLFVLGLGFHGSQKQIHRHCLCYPLEFRFSCKKNYKYRYVA